MSNYPLLSQSEEEKAPWNEEENPEREIEVTISISMSKNVKIKTRDYYMEDDYPIPCDPKNDVEEQIYLPQEAAAYLHDLGAEKHIVEDLSNWNIDEFIVI